MIAVRAYKIAADGGRYSAKEWFQMSIKAFKNQAPSLRFGDYEYVQLVPMDSWRKYPSGNDGSQGWRHKQTGWTIPDFCRQSGGYPEMWYKGKYRQVKIATNSPILNCLITH